MPHVYQRTPFNTSQPVIVVGTECSPNHVGARDLGFSGIDWQKMVLNNTQNQITGWTGTGTQVYTVEPGTIVYLNGTSTCFDNRRCTADCPDIPRCCYGCQEAHGIAVKGSDGFYTLYAHVFPNPALRVGQTVGVGTFLGNVDNSGSTQGPHVHFARFLPGSDNFWTNGGDCDWTMVGEFPSTTNGWVQFNQKWYYFVNGRLWTGWRQVGNWSYKMDNFGAWTGCVWNQASGYWFFNGNTWEKRAQEC